VPPVGDRRHLILSGVLAGGDLVWFALHYRLIHAYHLVDCAGSVEIVGTEDFEAGMER